MENSKEMKREAARNFWRKNEYELQEFVIKDGKKHPFAIICPGGGYSAVCSFVEGRPFAEKLNEMGISAFIVFYRVRKKAAFPNPQEDLARAVKDVFSRAEELQLDTEHYSVWGSSAGGHLAATFGTASLGWKRYGLPKPEAMVLVYPVITMTDLTHEGSRKNLLGKNPSEEMIKKTSVEQQIDENYPDTFVWCGDADKTVPPANSRMLAEQLKAHGVRCQWEKYPGVDHGVGLGIGLSCEGWLEKAVVFWLGEDFAVSGVSEG